MGTQPVRVLRTVDCSVRWRWVSWNDAQEFIRSLNAADPERESVPFADRGGVGICGAGGNERRTATPGILDAISWYEGNSEVSMHPVGQKAPNAWGLYDMLGNAVGMGRGTGMAATRAAL